MIIKTIFLLIMVLLTVGTAQTSMSLYTDIKAHSIGDVITVLIVETASARQESNVNARGNTSVDADATLAGTFTQFLPVFGASSVISSDVSNSTGSKQEDRLTGKITVSIIEKTESGLLKIQGERSVEVNGEENIMKLEGLVRPRDIKTDNTVFSYNIANAQIVYRQAGVVNAIASPATVQKSIALALVGGLIAYAFLGPGQ